MLSKRPSPSKPSQRSPGSSSRPITRSDRNSSPLNWRSWLELQITIKNLPNDVTTALLGEWFSLEGNITWINIRGGDDNGGTMASVRFEPPPGRPFWEQKRYLVRHPDLRQYPEGLALNMSISRDAPPDWIVSPISAGRRYPKRMKLPLARLEFGTMTSNKSMLVMKSTYNSIGPGELKLEVDLAVQRATVLFSMPVNHGSHTAPCSFKFEFDIGDMKRIYSTFSSLGSTRALVIPLSSPPRYYWKPSESQPTSSDTDRWGERDFWHRATDICEDRQAPLRYPVSLFNNILDPGYMEIGRWTAFRLVLKTDQQPEMAKHLQQLLMAFEDFNVAIDDTDLRVTYKTDEGAWMHADYLSSYTNSSALALLGSTVPRIEFEVRYQLEVCISRGLLNEYSITPEFIAKLAALKPMRARLQLEYLADQNRPLVDPLTLLENPEAAYYFPGNTTPHYCALVRKVNVTPTTMRLNTPIVETSNRVLREFSNVQDRFLRVQFVNEKESDRICRTNDRNYEEVWNRILRTFYQGIQIGDRHYEFLAYGSSQLRQCGAYFFAPIGDYTCDSIRQWMGSFDHIRVVAKYAARVGQCFSTTRPVRGSGNPVIHAIEDTERNGYCFTDGVGIISSLLSTIVIGEMGLDVVDTPSAFQFRMGGYKGVLAMWPQAKDRQIHARKSQQKFMAPYNGLEIIRCAKYTTATLNQQTIGILESLGVPISTFVRLLNQQIKAHRDATTDDKVAIGLLTKFVDENQNTLILAELLKAGFRSGTVQEPFVVNLMKLWHAWSLKLLKEKSRIHVEQSAFVLGCVDETGTLRGHSQETEGSKDKNVNKLPQISLRITDPNRYDKTIVITGLCIVGRNPSLHPGDIRVVQAVDNPKLEHLKDVVVFPSTGDRPIPNMLSGGDLDGDDFFIIWDQSLIPPEWNHPPMNYTGSKPVELDRDVTVDDMRNFFLKYMKQDTLGLIATAHKGQSDKHGPKSSICLKLAELHSQAVDFPKTGDPVLFSQKLQPRMWPHFMEKKGKYHSTKALGVLYDKVAKEPIQFSPNWEYTFDGRISNRYKLSDKLLDKARQIKSQYDISVRRILTQQKLQTEFELWSSFAMSRAVGTTDYKRQEDLGHEYDVLKQRFRDQCYEAAGGRDPEVIDPFVAAMYKVTAEDAELALQERRIEQAEDDGNGMPPHPLEPPAMPLISFPWIFHWVLIRIALGDEYAPKNSNIAKARQER